MLKKFWLIFRYKKIKDNKKAKVLPKVMQRIYDENSEMQGDKRGDDRSIQ